VPVVLFVLEVAVFALAVGEVDACFFVIGEGYSVVDAGSFSA
jgi:hypothetical protein